MQLRRSALPWLAALGASLGALHAHAEASDKPLPPARYSAQLSVGVEYDSNVTIDELEANSKQDDHALVLGAKVGVKKQVSKAIDFGLSYDLNQTAYEEFNRLDRQTHILGGNLGYKMESVDTGLSFYYVNSLLDGEGFLELYRVSPSVTGFISRRWYARGAWVYADKRIDNSAERNADTHGLELDLYFFQRGLRSYFNAGYRYKQEDATLERLDYRAHAAKLRYIRRIDIGSLQLKSELSFRYEDREYDGLTPGLDGPRDDKRQRWQVDVEIPTGKRGSVQLYASYGDYESNFAATDYRQGIAGARYLWRW
ncbi:surface lipoprotein assembly modifier [Haliea atlantica]|jgi:hypothetical protein|nr:hypothetical protein [Haliea sp.]